MPTKKKRTNISLDEDLDEILSIIAERDEVPKATKARQLIEIALEMEEDEWLEKLANERNTPDAKFVSHEEAWK